MTSFNVGGRYIDLPANFNLQFVKKNALFAFDDLECERTTSFAVPKTPNNMQIFGFANDFHQYGAAMRTRVEAQMQNGVVVKNGYLYVSKFSGDNFDCIFVTGELLFLQKIRDLGDWSEFIPTDILCAMDEETILASNSENVEAARVEYKTDGRVQPSWLLPRLAELACVNAGASVQWGDTLRLLSGYRIIAGKAKGARETSVTLTRTWLAEQVPYNNDDTPVTNTMTAAGLGGLLVSEIYPYPIFSVETATAQQWYGKVEVVVAKQDLILSFPDDTPATLFLGTLPQYGGAFNFLGGYTLNRGGTVSGEPLAGREVEIPTGTNFCLVTNADLLDGDPVFEAWRIANVTLSVTVSVHGKDEQPNNAIIRACDNVPEMTIAEMLKVIAALTGRILSVESGAVVFVENLYGDTMRDNLRVINWSDLSRTFSDYAQRNVVQFASDEEIPTGDRMNVVYTIDNVNITSEKELLTIPMSEGGYVLDGAYYAQSKTLYIRGDFDGYTLGVGLAGVYMKRVDLPKNSTLQGLLNVSTSVTMECQCTALDFERLSFGTRIWFDGAAWVWTEAQWSKDVARFTLARI